jgi:magnesium transporter
VGLCNGVILGALSLLLIGGLLFFRGEAPTLAFSVSLCTGVSLLIAMLLSSIAGTGIPLLFQKLKIDPAVASGPFITTVNDLVAVVTYYGLSWVLLIRVLQL